MRKTDLTSCCCSFCLGARQLWHLI